MVRNGKGRVVSLFADATGQILGCHGTDSQMELYYFCTDDEAQVRLKKRLARQRKKDR